MDSPTSSVESSPNAPRRFLPVHILNKLSPSKQVLPIVSDSECDSDDESVPLPTTYYTSPSRPEKRMHLSIPSPKMARLSIEGPARNLRSSIPGYGQGTKKTIRLTTTQLNRSESTSSAGSQHTFLKLGMQGAIPVSDPAFPTSALADRRRAAGVRPIQTRCVQKLFGTSPDLPEGVATGNTNSPEISSPRGVPLSKFPIRRWCAFTQYEDGPNAMREVRNPIVVSESDSSGGTSADDEEDSQSVAISRVVSEILGREQLDESDKSLFEDVDTVRSACHDDISRVDDTPESPAGFQEKQKAEACRKREKKRTERKDAISTANLTDLKIKEVSKYPCCEGLCLSKFGRAGVEKHRSYYYGLTHTEKNVLLRGCLKQNLQGQTGYTVNGNSFCREAFKKLYSVGNDRLKRVSADIFCRIESDRFQREKSTTQLALEQWLNDFFSTNVESLPDKDIFHLPDNWTKLEVFEAFKADASLRESKSLTYLWFCRIWNIEFPRVRIPKRSRFSTCTSCTKLKALRAKATLESEKSMLCLFSLSYRSN